MHKRIRILFSVCLLVVCGTPALAQQSQGPYYNPATKSYFELRFDNTKGYWPDAARLARSKRYRGVNGRLAIVNDRQTHEFLSEKFKIKVETWIGLRYWCSFRRLQWVDGNLMEKKDYSHWSKKWFRNASTKCGAGTAVGPKAFMPVYYRPTSQGFRWQASGPAKGFVQYFVEYPTGKP